MSTLRLLLIHLCSYRLSTGNLWCEHLEPSSLINNIHALGGLGALAITGTLGSGGLSWSVLDRDRFNFRQQLGIVIALECRRDRAATRTNPFFHVPLLVRS